LTSTVIVRRVTQNRMVTKGYRKGVYDRITEGTWFGTSFEDDATGGGGWLDGSAEAMRLSRTLHARVER
jgi:hypothetical protein